MLSTMKKSEVKRIIMMTRHGHRAPLSFEKDETHWKPPVASLTARGASAIYSKGKSLRSLFKEFFEGKTFDRTNTTVYASNLHRTVMTAYYLLRGLFNEEAKCDEIADTEEALKYLEHYQLIRKPIKHDVVLRFFNKGISETFQENIKSQTKKKMSEKIGDAVITKLLSVLPAEQKTALEDRNLMKLFYFYDTLTMYLSHDLPMPYNIPMDLYQELRFLQEVLDELLFGVPANIKLANYALIREVENLLADQTKVFTLFSAHDINVWSFLRLFGHDSNFIPFGGQWLLLCFEDGHLELDFYADSIKKIAEFPSTEKLVEYMKEKTYQNDADFLKELDCRISDCILKTYRESTATEIESEVKI
eukprot:TRINITY_DN1120_c0_g5_i2.p1 TRINITY_DN1120_c0_g5~~TRINITY_DN1120_c0_g5_i2.p1  ORF type:complete len:362 (+),score=67.38 TRINITY_DN1120_c0_g5_i2:79-1164(+)